MAIRLGFILLLFIFSAPVFSQSARDFMIGGGFDVIKSDNDKLFDKAQIGFEANYFVIREVTLNAGFEIWTNRDESFVFGARWYFLDNFFMRGRGLIGANDFSLGAGGAIPLNPNFRLEIIGDFYFEGDFAVRTGIAYIIRTR